MCRGEGDGCEVLEICERYALRQLVVRLGNMPLG